MEQLYCGIDLHAKDCQMCVIDREGAMVEEKKIKSDLDENLRFLKPHGAGTKIAVEATVNWYWLVDGLMGAGYDVTLAHPLGLRLITGAKVKTDRRDAYKLANLLRLNALPESYIYPKEMRPLRDLLRRRADLVRERTSCYVSLRMQFLQYNANTMSKRALECFTKEDFEMLPLPDELKAYGGMTVERITLLTQQIEGIEARLSSVVVSDQRFSILTGITGIGKILGLTIYYEAGDLSRFASPRHFSSYCRLVPSIHQSSTTVRRGSGGKQGNPYLKWAFMQAAMFSAYRDRDIRAFRDRKAAKGAVKGKNVKANAILARKLSIAVFHVLTEGVPFKKELLFA